MAARKLLCDDFVLCCVLCVVCVCVCVFVCLFVWYLLKDSTTQGTNSLNKEYKTRTLRAGCIVFPVCR